MIADLMEQAVDAVLYFGRFRLEEATEKLVDIVTKAAGGDHDAFSALMQRLDSKLRATIRVRSRGTLNGSDIDDVLQDVWMEVWAKGVLKKLTSPEGVVPLLNAIAKNKAINASKAKARAGAKRTSASDIAPVSIGVTKAGRGGGQLSAADKKIVRKAVTKALAKAKLKPDERLFVSMLFGTTPGGVLQIPGKQVPGSAQDVARAKRAGRTGADKTISAWASRIKRKFLRHFCTDRDLCDLLPSGRARSQLTKIPGLGQNACKNVKGSCMDDEVVAFAHMIGALHEGHPQNVEGEADELVLSWLTETLAGT